ncbi:hypothetical protein BDV95DRAFT_655321 [Massariosphaeria phaeospora]|uniref:Uncharacterized protein n=1 Tax=Massariosphaeria phaeospora TaxID=100035 RepID=A0A7C8IER4_9PLEO|nr:hypothetical protein BDV95DRAFT_655321 [Massariosphaeria phaeospora]
MGPALWSHGVIPTERSFQNPHKTSKTALIPMTNCARCPLEHDRNKPTPRTINDTSNLPTVSTISPKITDGWYRAIKAFGPSSIVTQVSKNPTTLDKFVNKLRTARRLLDRLETVFARNISGGHCDCLMCMHEYYSPEEERVVNWGEILELVSGRCELPTWWLSKRTHLCKISRLKLSKNDMLSHRLQEKLVDKTELGRTLTTGTEYLVSSRSIWSPRGFVADRPTNNDERCHERERAASSFARTSSLKTANICGKRRNDCLPSSVPPNPQSHMVAPPNTAVTPLPSRPGVRHPPKSGPSAEIMLGSFTQQGTPLPDEPYGRNPTHFIDIDHVSTACIWVSCLGIIHCYGLPLSPGPLLPAPPTTEKLQAH